MTTVTVTNGGTVAVAVTNAQPVSVTASQSATSGGVASIAALRALTARTGIANVLGYYVAGDGGGGTFRWDAASTAADDGGITILPTGLSGAGRWVRIVDAPVDVRAFGAKGDGTTDDTTAMQSALNCGEPVTAGHGTFLASNLTVGSYTRFRAGGRGLVTIKQKASSTGPLLASAHTYDGLMDLGGFTLDGNKANQSAANIGLDMVNTASGATHLANSKFGHQDPRNTISDILITNCKGSGLRQQGKGACSYSQIWAMECDGHGFEMLGYDNSWDQLDSGASGLCGFYMGPSFANNRVTNIKAWYSGQVDRATYGQGIMLDGAFGNQISTVEIQNPGSTGLHLKGAPLNVIGQLHIEFPPNPANLADGLYIEDSSHVLVTGAVIQDRGSSPYSLNRGIVIAKNVTGCGAVTVTASIANASGGIVGTVGGQTLSGCTLILNGTYWWGRTIEFGYVPTYASDAAAASAGLGIGVTYFSSTLNAFTKRQA